MLAFSIYGIIGLCVISILQCQAQWTSTRNCYYTLAVPPVQEQVAGEACIADVAALKSTVTNLQEQLTLLSKLVRTGDHPASKRGVNFKYWGSTQCSADTSIIYEGFAAKSHNISPGSGSEFLCLPKEPQWSGNEVAGLQKNSYIHGVEYWVNGLPDIISDSDRHTGVPCAVCETQSQNQQLMIPAATTCPTGWTTEYHGYLMAERHSHESSSNYICVKRQYEKIPGSAGNQPSGYAIPVEVVCGSLPCPPYEEGKELPCVLCTK